MTLLNDKVRILQKSTNSFLLKFYALLFSLFLFHSSIFSNPIFFCLLSVFSSFFAYYTEAKRQMSVPDRCVNFDPKSRKNITTLPPFFFSPFSNFAQVYFFFYFFFFSQMAAKVL